MDWNVVTDIALKFAAITVAFVVVLLIVAYTVLAERRILGFIQGRLGPNRVGYGGMLQPFADLLKFILKEEIVPDKSTKFVYFLAPMIAIMCALMPMIVYPFGPTIHIPFLVYGIALAGWSSNSKYSLMGGLRSSAQLISYELSLGLSLIGVILVSGTLDLYSIVEKQGGYWFYVIPRWNI